MQTVVEMAAFVRQADALFSAEERSDVIDLLAVDPLAGDEIPGTGGIRKLRVRAKGKGKRGGARVIYYYYDKTVPIFALMVYGKNEKTDMSADEARDLSRFVRDLKAAFRR